MSETNKTKPEQEIVEPKTVITKANTPKTQRPARSALDINRSYTPFLRTGAQKK
jgi:hypothetical protein